MILRKQSSGGFVLIKPTINHTNSTLMFNQLKYDMINIIMSTELYHVI